MRRSLFVLVAVLALSLVTMPAVADRDTDPPLFGPTRGDELQVMSFNLKYGLPVRLGANSWPRRRPVMAELLNREQPTVIGTQEGLYGQLTDMDRDLPDHYTWIGEGRAGGRRDEHMAVFYDTRRLEAEEHAHFWLSDTPEVAGSTSWGNRTVRMATWVRFADRRTGRELVVVNTHLDNVSEHARVRGAELLRDRIAAFPPALPVILTGDFNAPAEDSASYDVLTGAGLADTWTTAAGRRTPRYATWHGFDRPVLDGPRIDWILTRGAVSVESIGINTFDRGGQYPSDHLPVQVLATLG